VVVPVRERAHLVAAQISRERFAVGADGLLGGGAVQRVTDLQRLAGAEREGNADASGKLLLPIHAVGSAGDRAQRERATAGAAGSPALVPHLATRTAAHRSSPRRVISEH